jgi:hypothetical protein
VGVDERGRRGADVEAAHAAEAPLLQALAAACVNAALGAAAGAGLLRHRLTVSAMLQVIQPAELAALLICAFPRHDLGARSGNLACVFTHMPQVWGRCVETMGDLIAAGPGESSSILWDSMFVMVPCCGTLCHAAACWTAPGTGLRGAAGGVAHGRARGAQAAPRAEPPVRQCLAAVAALDGARIRHMAGARAAGACWCGHADVWPDDRTPDGQNDGWTAKSSNPNHLGLGIGFRVQGSGFRG